MNNLRKMENNFV